MTAASWRDPVRVHPAADLFPMMSDDELDELGHDIIKNGLGVGIVLWAERSSKKGPEELYLLDGRNRLAAIERAIPDPEERGGILDAMLNGGGLHEELRFAEPVIVYGQRWGMLFGPNGLSTGEDGWKADVDPYAYAVSANIHRRHLTIEKKRELIAKLIVANPELSDRAIAKMANDDHKKVGAVRAKVEANGEIPHKPAERKEASGRRARGRKRAAVSPQQNADAERKAARVAERYARETREREERHSRGRAALIDFLAERLGANMQRVVELLRNQDLGMLAPKALACCIEEHLGVVICDGGFRGFPNWSRANLARKEGAEDEAQLRATREQGVHAPTVREQDPSLEGAPVDQGARVVVVDAPAVLTTEDVVEDLKRQLAEKAVDEQKKDAELASAREQREAEARARQHADARARAAEAGRRQAEQGGQRAGEEDA
jgi:hypothetical protein